MKNSQMLSTNPIIFVHFGNNHYLKTNLIYAKEKNPSKDIILIGDNSNKYLTQYGIKHFSFEEFNNEDKIQSFHNVFIPIVNKEFRSQRMFWLKFVFLQYFYIYYFCLKNNIKSFWKFDSDTLILEDISAYEDKFSNFEIAISSKKLFHGYISDIDVLKGYIQHILDVFKNEVFLNDQKKAILPNKNYALTEMNVLNHFLDSTPVNAFYFDLNRDDFVINIYICDDAESKNYVSLDMLVFPWFIKLKSLLSIFKDNKHIYLKNKKGNYIKCVSLNLSWLPPILYNKIISCLNKPIIEKKDVIRSINIKIYFFDFFAVIYLHKIKRYLYSLKNKYHKP